MKQPTSEIVQVTPAMATKWLKELEQQVEAGKFKQRPTRPRAIKRYALDMRAGNWRLTHQGIGFDEAGHLIDGQNRLYAIVESRVTVPMMVSRGVQDNAMEVLDQGVPRSLWQNLQLSHGFAGEAVEAATVARGVVNMVYYSPLEPSQGRATRKPMLSTAQAAYLLNELDYLRAVQSFIARVPRKRMRPAGVVVPWSWYWKAFPRKAEQFADAYANLEGLTKGHPALMLHNWVVNSIGKYRHMEKATTASLIRQFHTGESKETAKASQSAYGWLMRQNPKDYAAVKKLIGR